LRVEHGVVTPNWREAAAFLAANIEIDGKSGVALPLEWRRVNSTTLVGNKKVVR